MPTENGVLLEDLQDGAYILYYPSSILMENVRFTGAEFNRLYTQRIKLPEGKGNIIYLMSDSFENCLKMISSARFIIPPNYRKIFFPQVIRGTFMGRRYMLNKIKDVPERRKLITNSIDQTLYPGRVMRAGNDNVFVPLSDIFQTLLPIMNKMSIPRLYQEFYPAFMDIIKGFTPDPLVVDEKKGSGTRLMIFDATAFEFKANASLKDNKTNPLFLLYLAYLRSRDLSVMGINVNMLICCKNMFLKFNPSRLDKKNLGTFRRSLFRIMNANMDDYAAALPPEDKVEINFSGSDKMLHGIVDKTIEPFTKNVTPATKSALTAAVTDELADKAQKIVKLDNAIKSAQASFNTTQSKDVPRVSDTNNDTTDANANLNLFKSNLGLPKQTTSLLNTNPVVEPLYGRKEEVIKSVAGSGYTPLAKLVADEDDGEYGEYDDYDDERSDDISDAEDEIQDDVGDVLSTSETVAAEVLDDIQERIAPMKNKKTAPVNSARDQKLREAQRKVMVQNMSIEEILSIDTNNVPIKQEDKSKVMHTTNENLKQVKFANFNKTYLNELYAKDIVSCFDQLKDKNNPFYVTDISVEDTSTALDYQETWTVSLVDAFKKKHTIKVDIPKFYNDRFMLIRGNKYMILPQDIYNPLVKDTPDTVILTTNYNKITIKRKATKSLSTVEKIFKVMKSTGDSEMFVPGNSSSSNLAYISSLEYDEISKSVFKFKSGKCLLCFSRDFIAKNMADKIPADIKGNEFYIGHDANGPVLINEDTGYDRQGRTISEIIEQNLPEEYATIYASAKAPKQSMYAAGKLAGQWLPIIVTLIVWEGLKKTLDNMGIKWEFHPGIKRIQFPNKSSKYIAFGDGVLEYESQIFSELILNGINVLHPEKFSFDAFETEEVYDEFIFSQWGNYSGINELDSFHEFLMDPITVDVCRMLSLPTDASGIIITAVKWLSDNGFVSKASDKSKRVRTIEIIPGILYSCIARQYKLVRGGKDIPMTLNRRCVISRLLKDDGANVDTYSTLNPAIEVAKTHTISPKGYRGTNEQHSYDEEKRSYDPSSIGKLAITTSADANVGVSRQLVVEPTITNARGFREQIDDPEQLKDVNIFAPIEMLTPGTTKCDDPIRSAIAAKQSQHVVPVKDAAPSLISNGFDEAIQFHLSDDFVINAEEDGEVVDINEELGLIVVRYKSGKNRAINVGVDVVHNSGGGFYMTNQLIAVHNKVGEKFKKDDVLAYHPDYFKYSKINGLRYAIGPLAKVAFCSAYNTYEDAGMMTEKLAAQMQSGMVYDSVGRFKRNHNILSMVKIGDHVNIGDPLIHYDVAVDEGEIAKYLSKLSDDNAHILEEETKTDLKATHAGVVVAIKVYSLIDPSLLSPSLAKIVQDYFDKGKKKNKYLSKFDNTNSVVKAGYMLTDTTEPIKDRYNAIKGDKGIDVRIEIYVKHDDTVKVGDKMALYGPNKQIVSEVVEDGLEPYSEFRPDEDISVLTSAGTIARRMTSSVLPIAAGTKCLVELKRKVKDMILYDPKNKKVRNRAEVLKVIYGAYNALDHSGTNTDKWKQILDPMPDSVFMKYMKDFLDNDHEYFMLDIVDYERELTMDACEKCAKFLGIPLMEYVFFPHITNNRKTVVCSAEKCLVGYFPVKRTQQFVYKKNGYSVSNEKVMSSTGQVTGKDKNARDSDMEASMLVSIGADKILQEFHGPRADDIVMKRQMNQSIASKGYVVLDDLENLPTNKVTLNTVNTWFLAMGLKTDLITDTNILPKTSEELFGS